MGRHTRDEEPAPNRPFTQFPTGQPAQRPQQRSNPRAPQRGNGYPQANDPRHPGGHGGNHPMPQRPDNRPHNGFNPAPHRGAAPHPDQRSGFRQSPQRQDGRRPSGEHQVRRAPQPPPAPYRPAAPGSGNYPLPSPKPDWFGTGEIARTTDDSAPPAAYGTPGPAPMRPAPQAPKPAEAPTRTIDAIPTEVAPRTAAPRTAAPHTAPRATADEIAGPEPDATKTTVTTPASRAETADEVDAPTTFVDTRRGGATGYHRPADGRPSGAGQTATGYHRAIGKDAKRRRIAKWPIACVALVALVALGWLGFSWAESESNTRAEAQAASCQDGDSTLRVLVTPSAEKAAQAAAASWNSAKKVVHAHCITVQITTAGSEQVLNALTGRSNVNAIGGMPAAWIPESSYWIDELTTNRPELIGSPAESVASARSAEYRYLGLSGKGVDEVQKRAAQSFRDYLKEPAQQSAFTG